MVIDGNLNEEAWEDAVWSSSFIDIEGSTKAPPQYDTKVKMLWDSTYLYIGALLEEEHLWATYDQDESIIFHENDFEIFIYNRWGALIFQSNFLEFQWDGTVNGELVPQGTYPYIIRFTSRFEPERGVFEQFGSITVVR